jgi:hypothetical protein
VPDAEMFSAPGDALVEADQAGRDSFGGDGLFAPMNISGEMDLDAAGEIETSFDGGADDGQIFKCHHLNTFNNSMRLGWRAVNHYFERVQNNSCVPSQRVKAGRGQVGNLPHLVMAQ